MTSKIQSLEIRYVDGSVDTISSFEIERLERLKDVIALIERARMLFNSLRPIFEEAKKK